MPSPEKMRQFEAALPADQLERWKSASEEEKQNTVRFRHYCDATTQAQRDAVLEELPPEQREQVRTHFESEKAKKVTNTPAPTAAPPKKAEPTFFTTRISVREPEVLVSDHAVVAENKHEAVIFGLIVWALSRDGGKSKAAREALEKIIMALSEDSAQKQFFLERKARQDLYGFFQAWLENTNKEKYKKAAQVLSKQPADFLAIAIESSSVRSPSDNKKLVLRVHQQNSVYFAILPEQMVADVNEVQQYAQYRELPANLAALKSTSLTKAFENTDDRAKLLKSLGTKYLSGGAGKADEEIEAVTEISGDPFVEYKDKATCRLRPEADALKIVYSSAASKDKPSFLMAYRRIAKNAYAAALESALARDPNAKLEFDIDISLGSRVLPSDVALSDVAALFHEQGFERVVLQSQGKTASSLAKFEDRHKWAFQPEAGPLTKTSKVNEFNLALKKSDDALIQRYAKDPKVILEVPEVIPQPGWMARAASQFELNLNQEKRTIRDLAGRYGATDLSEADKKAFVAALQAAFTKLDANSAKKMGAPRGILAHMLGQKIIRSGYLPSYSLPLGGTLVSDLVSGVVVNTGVAAALTPVIEKIFGAKFAPSLGLYDELVKAFPMAMANYAVKNAVFFEASGGWMEMPYTFGLSAVFGLASKPVFGALKTYVPPMVYWANRQIASVIPRPLIAATTTLSGYCQSGRQALEARSTQALDSSYSWAVWAAGLASQKAAANLSNIGALFLAYTCAVLFCDSESSGEDRSVQPMVLGLGCMLFDTVSTYWHQQDDLNKSLRFSS